MQRIELDEIPALWLPKTKKKKEKLAFDKYIKYSQRIMSQERAKLTLCAHTVFFNKNPLLGYGRFKKKGNKLLMQISTSIDNNNVLR